MKNPVRVLAITVAALTAFLGLAAAPLPGVGPLLPTVVLAWGAVVLGVLTVVGGELARGNVTPLVDPKTSSGAPLVPAPRPWSTSAGDGPTSDLPPRP